MRGSIGSLNASVAGSILLFEALGQRIPGDDRSPGVVRVRSATSGDIAPPDVPAEGAAGAPTSDAAAPASDATAPASDASELDELLP